MRPHRHVSGTPKPLCTLDPQRIEPTAAQIVERVRANTRGGRGQSFVYIDPEMQVYVIHEQHAAAKAWASDLAGHWRHLVGVYDSGRSREAGLSASVDGVIEDVGCHLADLGACK